MRDIGRPTDSGACRTNEQIIKMLQRPPDGDVVAVPCANRLSVDLIRSTRRQAA